MIRKLFLIFVGMLLLCGCASATDYYVSPTGTGDGLTIETPGNPSVLDASLVAGDTMYFLDGTYTGEILSLSASGTVENPITLTAYTGAAPVLENDWTGVFISLHEKHYINFSGLTIKKYYQGIDIKDCSNINLDGLEIEAKNNPVYYSDSNNSVIENCTMYNTTAGGNTLGIALETQADLTHNITIKNNIIYDNTRHNGIDIFNAAYPSADYAIGYEGEYFVHDVLIENNTIYNVTTACGIYTHGNGPYRMDRITIKNNTIHDCYSLSIGYLNDSVLDGNIFYNHYTNGLIASVTQMRGNVTVSNSTAWNNTGYDIYLSVANSGTLYINNNNCTKLRFTKFGYYNIQNQIANSYNVLMDYSTNYNNATITNTNGRVLRIAVSNAAFGTYTQPEYTSSGSYSALNSTGGINNPIYTITNYNYTVLPSSGSVSVTPYTPIGNEVASFKATSTTQSPTTFSAFSLTPGNSYLIEEDGVSIDAQVADANGEITWSESALTDHTYTVTGTTPAAPVADFAANITSGVAPTTIQFSDTSFPVATSWSWDFDGDSVEDSTDQNPTWTYSTNGLYTVSLTATNAIGSDTETKPVYIIVADNLGSFESQVSSSADDAFEQGTGYFSSTITRVEVSSATDPLASAYVCGGARFQGITIPPGSIITSAHLGLYVGSDIYDNPNMTIYADDVNDSVNFSTNAHIISRSRTTNNSVWSASGVPVGWVNSSDISSVVQEIVSRDGWTDGNDLTLLLIANEGAAQTLRASSYNEDTAKAPKLFIEYTTETPDITPVASFSSDISSGYVPLTVQFTDTSSNSPIAWSWDFDGDGSEDSTLQNPTWIYTTAGNYTVSLTATNEGGSDSETAYINVLSTPSTFAEIYYYILSFRWW